MTAAEQLEESTGAAGLEGQAACRGREETTPRKPRPDASSLLVVDLCVLHVCRAAALTGVA